MESELFLCRLCLSKENLKPLFCSLEQSENYSMLLTLVTGLLIKENDGFPQTICNICSELVDSAISLRNTSQNSEMKLFELGYKKNIYNEQVENETKIEEIDKEEDQINELDTGISENLENIEIVPNCHRQENLKEEKQIDYVHNFFIENEFTKPRAKLLEFKSETFQDNVTVPEDTLSNKKDKTLSRKEKRAVYMNLVEGEYDPKGPIKCKICKKSVSKWASFMTHSKLHLGFKFVCEYCGKSFVSSTQLNRHCRSHHGMTRELACKYCDYLALDSPQLVLHERRVHTGERPFICDLCGTSYFSRRCLIQHIENHSTVKTIECEKCCQMFKSRRHLARHTYTAHTSKQYMYKCPICAHIYRNFKYIRVHLKKLHGLTTKEAKIVKIKL